jgi:signal transduction histidine kinase
MVAMIPRPSADSTAALIELHNIYATAPVGLCCVDRDLRYVSINDRLAAMNGLAAQAHVGRTLREMVPEIADEIEAVYRRVFATGRPEIDVELIGPSPVPGDPPRRYRCSYSPVCDERDRVVAVNTVVQDVTDRHAHDAALYEVHQTLRQRDEFLDVIADKLPQAMLFRAIYAPDGTLRFAYVSRGAEAVLGLPPERLLREPAAFIEQIADEDRPSMVESMMTAIRALTPLDRVCRMRQPDGSVQWCHIRSAHRALENGSVVCEGIMLNTTRLKAAEEALVESEARNQAILSALPDIVFLQSRDGTYLDVHPRDDPRLLLPADQFIGRNMIDILPPELGRQLQRCFEQVATDGSAHADYTMPFGGELRQYEARMVPCGTDRILAIVRDVTESKRAHHDAERSRLELAHISRLTLLGEITASLAHELNQPLTAILSNAQAARYGLTTVSPAERELDEMLQEIVDAGKRAGDVIRRVRTWLTREQFLPQDLEINQVVADVERLLHSELIMRHVQLVLDLQADLPAVSADRVQLQQVVLNVALNGIDAMHDRPVSDRQLLIATSRVEGGVQVAVRDRGTGIHPDHMDRLFDPFFSTKPTGLGVGLRICSSIVTAHRGRIWAENNDGSGATFFFTLPSVAQPA